MKYYYSVIILIGLSTSSYTGLFERGQDIWTSGQFLNSDILTEYTHLPRLPLYILRKIWNDVYPMSKQQKRLLLSMVYNKQELVSQVINIYKSPSYKGCYYIGNHSNGIKIFKSMDKDRLSIPVYAICFHPYKFMCAQAHGDYLRIVDLKHKRILMKIDISHPEKVVDMNFSQDGGFLYLYYVNPQETIKIEIPNVYIEKYLNDYTIVRKDIDNVIKYAPSGDKVSPQSGIKSQEEIENIVDFDLYEECEEALKLIPNTGNMYTHDHTYMMEIQEKYPRAYLIIKKCFQVYMDDYKKEYAHVYRFVDFKSNKQ